MAEPALFKVCTKESCLFNRRPQPSSSFCKNSRSRDGLSYWCKNCRSESSLTWQKQHKQKHRKYNRSYRAKNAPAINARIKKWQTDNTERVRKNGREYKRKHAEEIKLAEKRKKASDPLKYWIRKALARCKNRAKEKTVAFSLTKEDFLPLPELCCVFGIKLDYLSGPDKRAWASVDRIRPTDGYVQGNIRIISRAANMAKLDGVGDVVNLHA